MSTQLLFTNMALASADLPGDVGFLALVFTFVVPMYVGLLRMFILRCLLFKVGHAKNDLRVLPKDPETCKGHFQKGLYTLPISVLQRLLLLHPVLPVAVLQGKFNDEGGMFTEFSKTKSVKNTM